MTTQQNAPAVATARGAKERLPDQYTTPPPDIRRASELFKQGFLFREDGRIVRHSKFEEILPDQDGWAVAIGTGNYRYEARVFWPWVMDQEAGRV